MTGPGAPSTAVLSPDGVYRYQLSRWWATGPRDLWVMLNPSTADATVDDPTIRRCIAFSKGWGSGSLTVVNLFALRATNPAVLRRHPDPIGPDNDRNITAAAAAAKTAGGKIIAAWGANPGAVDRSAAVQAIIRAKGTTLLALGTTKTRAPRHPLYVPGSAVPSPWTPR